MTDIVQRFAEGISYLACDGGSETPIVLLHGIGSNADCFRPLMAELAHRHPSFAWNAPGYGDSKPLAAEWPDASDYAAALNRLLLHLGISRCILVGHSLGCLFAGRFALVAARRVAALFLISPASGYQTPKGHSLPRAVATRLEELDRLGNQEFAAARAPGLLADPAARPELLKRVAAAMAAVRRPGYDQAARALAGGSLLADAAKIEVPTAVIVGTQDRITPPDKVRGVFEALQPTAGPHAYREIDGAGHAVCQEEPQQVAQAMIQFIEKRVSAHREKKKRARGPTGYIAPPVQRAVRLIRHIAEGHPVLNMSESAKTLGINRTTLLRLLHTLEVEGFVERRPGGAGYQVGLALLEVGARAVFSQDLVQVTVPVLTTLAEELQLSAHLGVLDGTDVLYLVRRTPNTPLASNIRVGSRLPAHATTMGRMLLAHRPAIEIDTLYAGKELQRFSEQTSTTLAAVQAKAESDRRVGIAWSEAHFERGIGSAAVPVFDYAGAPVAAINVSGPIAAFAKERRDAIGSALRRAGEEISRRLGWIEADERKPAPARSLAAAE
jgi:DNA-binding IclR family transcriptional regulator/pimeloyl-ACP methyl ester carboxylesterase